MKRRLVLLLACETLLPTIGAFPVTWQTRAIARSRITLIGATAKPAIILENPAPIKLEKMGSELYYFVAS